MRSFQKLFLFILLSLAFGLSWAEEHWEVLVHLKNKTVLRGVVLSERFQEKFVASEGIWIKTEQKSNSGLRLWFVSDSPGFIFLKQKDIVDIERIRNVSQEEVNRILSPTPIEEEKKEKISAEDLFPEIAKKVEEQKKETETEKTEKKTPLKKLPTLAPYLSVKKKQKLISNFLIPTLPVFGTL